MRFFFRSFCCEVMISRVSTNDTTTEHDITQDTMHSNRVPQCGVNHVPDVSKETTLLINSTGSLHEGRPGIRQIHKNGTDEVQQYRQGAVNPFQEGIVLHLFPAIVVNIENTTFSQEHESVNVHYRTENTRHVLKEPGKQRNEGKK